MANITVVETVENYTAVLFFFDIGAFTFKEGGATNGIRHGLTPTVLCLDRSGFKRRRAIYFS